MKSTYLVSELSKWLLEVAYSDKYSFVLEVNVLDRELVRQRHVYATTFTFPDREYRYSKFVQL